jgi:hypothetical protein
MTLDPTIEARVRAWRALPITQDHLDALALLDEVERLRDARADEHRRRCADQLDLAGARALLAEQTARAERAEAERDEQRASAVAAYETSHRYEAERDAKEGSCVAITKLWTDASRERNALRLVAGNLAEALAARDTALAANAEMRAALESTKLGDDRDDGKPCWCGSPSYPAHRRKTGRPEHDGHVPACGQRRALLSRPDLGAGPAALRACAESKTLSASAREEFLDDAVVVEAAQERALKGGG